MKNDKITEKIDALKTNIDKINSLIEDLKNQEMEVRLVVREDQGSCSKIELFKAVAHVDYLK